MFSSWLSVIFENGFFEHKMDKNTYDLAFDLTNSI